jgi:hypothetical protein
MRLEGIRRGRLFADAAHATLRPSAARCRFRNEFHQHRRNPQLPHEEILAPWH